MVPWRMESIAQAVFAEHRREQPNRHRHPSIRGRPRGADRSALERRVLEHGLTVDERPEDSCLTDRARRAIEQVAIEYHEIGGLAGLERSHLAFEVVDPGRPGGESR